MKSGRGLAIKRTTANHSQLRCFRANFAVNESDLGTPADNAV